MLYCIRIYIDMILGLMKSHSLPYRQLSPDPLVQCGQSSGLCVWSVHGCCQPKSISGKKKKIINEQTLLSAH